MTPEQRALDIAGKCAAGRECDCEQDIIQALRDERNVVVEEAKAIITPFADKAAECADDSEMNDDPLKAMMLSIMLGNFVSDIDALKDEDGA